MVDALKKLVDRFEVMVGKRIPVDNESKVNPAVLKEHAASNGSRMESR
jgi:hypothetical protein